MGETRLDLQGVSSALKPDLCWLEFVSPTMIFSCLDTTAKFPSAVDRVRNLLAKF